ncbi:MAG TPA: glycosyltransferase family 39 protein, partial [Acidobacteriota bacterium]
MLTNKSLLGRKVSKLLPIAALLLVAITIQILVLRAGRIHWTSDQAVVAIMARDIVQRGAHPVFYYGSAYAGSLEPHWVAFCFALFGVSITTYHLAMIALLVVLLCIVYGTTRTAFSRPVALLAVGYLALPPYFFLYKGLTSDGAYDAVAILGAFLLYAALRLEASIRQSGKVRLWVTVLGLAAGMGWWVDPLIVYFYLAVLAWFVVVRPSVFLQLSFYPFFIGAFLMGGFPWWVNNIRFSWHSLTAPELAAAPQGQIINQFAGFWKLGLPIILASRPVFNRVDTYGGESIVSAVLYLVPTFLLLFYVLKHRKLLRSKPVGEIPAQARTLLLLLLPLLIVPCLVAVNNRSDLSEPRYLFALYAFYPIAFGFSI